MAAFGPHVVDRVLDNVERRGFLVEPAREHALPSLVGLKYVDLNESAGKFFLFPWSSRFARAQMHQYVLPSCRLAGVKSDVFHNAVALVEDAKDSDPLRHRRHSGLIGRDRSRPIASRARSGLRLIRAIAGREGQPEQERNSDPRHAYSGIQGS